MKNQYLPGCIVMFVGIIMLLYEPKPVSVEIKQANAVVVPTVDHKIEYYRWDTNEKQKDFIKEELSELINSHFDKLARDRYVGRFKE